MTSYCAFHVGTQPWNLINGTTTSANANGPTLHRYIKLPIMLYIQLDVECDQQMVVVG